MGDPMELQVHGYELTLRLADADQIEIEKIDARAREHKGLSAISNAEHPGLGEEGKYHVKGSKKTAAGGGNTYICAGGKSELWKDDTV